MPVSLIPRSPCTSIHVAPTSLSSTPTPHPFSPPSLFSILSPFSLSHFPPPSFLPLTAYLPFLPSVVPLSSPTLFPYLYSPLSLLSSLSSPSSLVSTPFFLSLPTSPLLPSISPSHLRPTLDEVTCILQLKFMSECPEGACTRNTTATTARHINWRDYSNHTIFLMYVKHMQIMSTIYTDHTTHFLVECDFEMVSFSCRPTADQKQNSCSLHFSSPVPFLLLFLPSFPSLSHFSLPFYALSLPPSSFFLPPLFSSPSPLSFSPLLSLTSSLLPLPSFLSFPFPPSFLPSLVSLDIASEAN